MVITGSGASFICGWNTMEESGRRTWKGEIIICGIIEVFCDWQLAWMANFKNAKRPRKPFEKVSHILKSVLLKTYSIQPLKFIRMS